MAHSARTAASKNKVLTRGARRCTWSALGSACRPACPCRSSPGCCRMGQGGGMGWLGQGAWSGRPARAACNSPSKTKGPSARQVRPGQVQQLARHAAAQPCASGLPTQCGRICCELPLPHMEDTVTPPSQPTPDLAPQVQGSVLVFQPCSKRGNATGCMPATSLLTTTTQRVGKVGVLRTCSGLATVADAMCSRPQPPRRHMARTRLVSSALPLVLWRL